MRNPSSSNHNHPNSLDDGLLEVVKTSDLKINNSRFVECTRELAFRKVTMWMYYILLLYYIYISWGKFDFDEPVIEPKEQLQQCFSF